MQDNIQLLQYMSKHHLWKKVLAEQQRKENGSVDYEIKIFIKFSLGFGVSFQL